VKSTFFCSLICGAMLLSAQTPTPAPEGELRVWRAVGEFRTEAVFVAYDAGLVRLRKKDGSEISVRIEQLVPQDRAEVMRLAGANAHGALPAGQIQAPTGRRELTWKEINLGEPWPTSMTSKEKDALLTVGREWKHAETEFFIIHYQQVAFAKRVGRMADFFYQYIASDLPGFQDRQKEKSHIVVVRNSKEWKEFIEKSQTAPEWAAAYVYGQIMYVQDTGDNETNADILAHEMSHLVLNRFFARTPPLWLNEGLAEWYEAAGWKAFKGQRVNPKEGLGRMADAFTIPELMGMRGYPDGEAQVHRFYRSCRQAEGFLKLEKDQSVFVKFLQAVTVKGADIPAAVKEHYGFENVEDWQKAFIRFLR
jgi:hypothetical protein